MSRKHFTELAAIIRSAREEHGESPALDDIEREITSFCARQNGNFDRGRFAAACKARA